MKFFATVKKTATNSVADTSPKLTVNKTDIAKTLIHLVFVGVAAMVTVGSEQLMNIDFGQFSAFIVPVVSSVLVFIQKWIKDNDPVIPKV